jgi:hypothetical protein
VRVDFDDSLSRHGRPDREVSRTHGAEAREKRQQAALRGRRKLGSAVVGRVPAAIDRKYVDADSVLRDHERSVQRGEVHRTTDRRLQRNLDRLGVGS